MLTVSEALLFAARLRLPEYVTDTEKRQRVEDVLEQLGLTHVRDSRIGGRTSHARGISGGEMRRVSIGLELVASPDVLILDEPTSGSSLTSRLNVYHLADFLSCFFARPGFGLRRQSRLGPARPRARHGQPDGGNRDDPPTEFADLPHLRSRRPPLRRALPVRRRGRIRAGGILCRTGFAVCAWVQRRGPSARHCARAASGPGQSELQQGGYWNRGQRRRTWTRQRAEETRETDERSGVLDAAGGASRAGVEGATKVRAGLPASFLPLRLAIVARDTLAVMLTFRTFRDKTFFLAHIVISAFLGVFCGGLYWHTGITIAGFQSRVGSLFFLVRLSRLSPLIVTRFDLYAFCRCRNRAP